MDQMGQLFNIELGAQVHLAWELLKIEMLQWKPISNRLSPIDN
jgi:hypothetical protein